MKKTLLVAMLASLLLVGCEEKPRKKYVTKFEAIFMHAPGTYSILHRTSDKGLVSYYFGHAYETDYILLDDVPTEESCWAEYEERGCGCGGNKSKTIIHIHSLQEIRGGEYQSGKNNYTKTNRIEP